MAYKRAMDEMFIEGAIRTVAAVGIENTRTKDVAEYTGFSEATLFRRFGTKEGLLKSTFLSIDKEISDILMESAYIRDPDDTPFELALYAIWRRVYHYLLEHRDETIFLIRYRYSSLYTDEVRSQREAYNGGFEKAYAVFEQHFGSFKHTYRGFLINYIFELTLCFAEKIITGKVENIPEVERSVWAAITAALKVMTES